MILRHIRPKKYFQIIYFVAEFGSKLFNKRMYNNKIQRMVLTLAALTRQVHWRHRWFRRYVKSFKMENLTEKAKSLTLQSAGVMIVFIILNMLISTISILPMLFHSNEKYGLAETAFFVIA